MIFHSLFYFQNSLLVDLSQIKENNLAAFEANHEIFSSQWVHMTRGDRVHLIVFVFKSSIQFATFSFVNPKLTTFHPQDHHLIR